MFLFEREGVELHVEKSAVRLNSGIESITIEIPVLVFKSFLFRSFSAGVRTTYGDAHSSMYIYKSLNSKYEKLWIKITNQNNSGSIYFFRNELSGLALRLRELHNDKEEINICQDQIRVTRNNNIVNITDLRNGYSYELYDQEKDVLWGTLLLRLYGVQSDGIFGDLSIQGNILKFPFSAKKKRILNPFSLEDAAKLTAIL
ncbi:hypothetical protein [Desulfurobacterium crinifex]